MILSSLAGLSILAALVVGGGFGCYLYACAEGKTDSVLQVRFEVRGNY